MFRSAVVIAVLGLLLADPILCRAEAATAPCAEACRRPHDSSRPHPGPAEPGHDEAHGCICQGATRGADGETSSSLLAVEFLPIFSAESPPLPPRGPGRSPTPAAPLRGRLGGRSLRIERQSFLF